MKLLTLVFATAIFGSSLTQPTWAQTARIAHFSHSGSPTTLTAAAIDDNFGTPPAYFIVDSIRLISDTSALEYGTWHGYHASSKSEVQTQVFATHRSGEGHRPMSAKAYVAQSVRHRPQLKVVGYDTIPKTAIPALSAPDVEKHKTKTRRKKGAVLPASPAMPPHPGVLLGIVLVIGLGSAGWLLGEQPRPVLGPEA